MTGPIWPLNSQIFLGSPRSTKINQGQPRSTMIYQDQPKFTKFTKINQNQPGMPFDKFDYVFHIFLILIQIDFQAMVWTSRFYNCLKKITIMALRSDDCSSSPSSLLRLSKSQYNEIWRFFLQPLFAPPCPSIVIAVTAIYYLYSL